MRFLPLGGGHRMLDYPAVAESEILPDQLVASDPILMKVSIHRVSPVYSQFGAKIVQG